MGRRGLDAGARHRKGGGCVDRVEGAAAEIVFYFDIRCRMEGFDIEHLAALVEQQGVQGVAGG